MASIGKEFDNFKYWVETNEERGVCYIPDFICDKTIEFMKKQHNEIKRLNLLLKQNNIEDYNNAKDVIKSTAPRFFCGETFHDYICPVCHSRVAYEDELDKMSNHCDNCGQLLRRPLQDG